MIILSWIWLLGFILMMAIMVMPIIKRILLSSHAWVDRWEYFQLYEIEPHAKTKW